MTIPATIVSPMAVRFADSAAIVGRLIPATSIDPTSAKATRKPNQTARFMITPTTAAVMPESAADKCTLSRKRSM